MITGVCISEKKQSLDIDMPFMSYTDGYRPTPSRDLHDISRIEYLTKRYNDGISLALRTYPQTEHVLVIDHYYVPFSTEIKRLINDYSQLSASILGASIWYWARRRIKPWIAYYDTMSAPEFVGKTWKNLRSLPHGIIPVSGVGACWIFPRRIWEHTKGFRVPTPAQAGSSRCLDTSGFRVLLDCDSRLWRTHETNPSIPDYPMSKRFLETARHAKRKVFRAIWNAQD
jgi:hypothetical protein